VLANVSRTHASAKINISYSILFNLTTSYSSYFGGKKGVSRNKTSFFLLMCHLYCMNGRMIGKEWKDGWGRQEGQVETDVNQGWVGGDEASARA